MLYTDNSSLCDTDIEQIELDESEDLRVNFRFPTRQYLDHSGQFKMFIEKPGSGEDLALMVQAVARLSASLAKVFTLLPPHSHGYLQDVDFYIMLGPRSSHGGEKSGARYYAKDANDLLQYGDTRWRHAVVIYSVENFLALSDLWVDKVVVHELAHAWHYHDWPSNYPILNKAWLGARQKGLYLAQRDIHGRVLKPAYASTNEREYFAELSAMYFVEGDYHPFNGAGLLNYDRDGFRMVEEVWGL